jgi:glycosyltransferase involved in cell wall biosynthesis
MLNRHLGGIFRNEPDSGIVYFDDDNFTQNFERLTQDRTTLHQLGYAGRKYARHYYSWDEVAKKYMGFVTSTVISP